MQAREGSGWCGGMGCKDVCLYVCDLLSVERARVMCEGGLEVACVW
jgi:hypothetical protein